MAWKLRSGMANEIAPVYYQDSEESEFVLAFYDPNDALQNRCPVNEGAYGGLVSPMNVTLPDGFDNINSPQEALASPYLYDPEKKG
ncbi:hypothetical protein ABG067_007164 [Albugo candida]